jgi:hydrogenase expression/formation protein HypD
MTRWTENDSAAVRNAAHEISNLPVKDLRVMEICGGHTMVIRKNGLDKLIKGKVRFLSGPGCPVCVTSQGDIDRCISFAKIPGVCLCTFGDLFRVPGTSTNLQTEKAKGADVRIVYSVHDALRYAEEEKNKIFIFAGIGFETTAPTVAAALLEAHEKKLDNFCLFCLHKTVPLAVEALLSDKETQVEALILPGHVSAIIGEKPYEFIASRFNLPGCITGFSAAAVMESTLELCLMSVENKPLVKNYYPAVVKPEGNTTARHVMETAFEPCDADWRGLGPIPGSGLKIRKSYERHDAEIRYTIPRSDGKEFEGCRCGEVLKGRIQPTECALFGKKCTPEDPKGSCMVSSEGVCAAWYLYGGE